MWKTGLAGLCALGLWGCNQTLLTEQLPTRSNPSAVVPLPGTPPTTINPVPSPKPTPTATPAPTVAPTPTPIAPTPSPTPAPVASSCPLKVDGNHYVKVIVSPFGGGHYTESTQLCVNSLPNDMPLGHCGTHCCFIGVIDVPPSYATCDDELFGGPPTWTVSGPADITVDPSQPYNVLVSRSGDGRVTLSACGNKGPCGSVDAP
jgi:hypothetical protein